MDCCLLLADRKMTVDFGLLQTPVLDDFTFFNLSAILIFLSFFFSFPLTASRKHLMIKLLGKSRIGNKALLTYNIELGSEAEECINKNSFILTVLFL